MLMIFDGNLQKERNEKEADERRARACRRGVGEDLEGDFRELGRLGGWGGTQTGWRALLDRVPTGV